MGGIFFAIIMGMVGMVFLGLGCWVIKQDRPCGFWTGQEVRNEEVSDVKGYNKELGSLWLGFGALIWLVAIVGGIFGGAVGGIGMCIAFVIGIPMLPVLYNRIYRKYQKK